MSLPKPDEPWIPPEMFAASLDALSLSRLSRVSVACWRLAGQISAHQLVHVAGSLAFLATGLKIDVSRPTLHQTSSLINWTSGFKLLLEATDRQWSANILTEGALHLKGGGSMGKGKGQNLSICNHMIGM